MGHFTGHGRKHLFWDSGSPRMIWGQFKEAGTRAEFELLGSQGEFVMESLNKSYPLVGQSTVKLHLINRQQSLMVA